MPPLQLFGRSWHVSSDDLVLPALVGVAFHGTWTALLIAEVVAIGLPDDCDKSQLASSSVLWLLTSFAVTTVLQCVVAGISMRGAMLEEQKRAAIPSALYCLFSAYGLEAAALVYATIVTFGVLKDSLYTCHTQEELSRTSISELSMNRWFVGTTWAMLTIICGLLVLLYNLYPDRGLESWEKRVNCLSYMLCCRKALGADADDDQAGASTAPTVVRLARVFGDLFYPLNFSFSDTLAAITLVGITHRSSAHGHGSSSHNHAMIAAAGAGLLAPARQDTAIGAAALLEAAAAASAAQAAVVAASGLDTKHTASSALLQQQPDCINHPAPAPAPGSTQGAAAAPGAYTPDCQSHVHRGTQQAAVAADQAVAAAGVGEAPLAPQVMVHSRSTGNLPVAGTGSSPVPQESLLCVRSGSSSAWEAAVRQGSALAVAPGRRMVSAGAGTAPVQGSSRSSSPMQQAHGTGLHGRSHSTCEAGAAQLERGPSPSRLGHRAISWGGAAAPEQQLVEQGREQGHSRPKQEQGQAREVQPYSTLQSLAEAGSHEQSMTVPGVIEQVESLLSPLPSAEVPSTAAQAGGMAEPAAGAAATGDAIGGAAAPGSMSYGGAACRQLDLSAVKQQAAGRELLMGKMSPALYPAAAARGKTESAAEEVLEQMGAVMQDGRPVPLELLEEALHWHSYANAIYGWPMFLWSHRYRVLRCCRLCCGGCCQGAPHSSRSSGGGLSIPHHHTSTRSVPSSGQDDSKAGTLGSSGAPMTAVVTLSSLDTDSASPVSTIAGYGEQQPGLAHARGAPPVAAEVKIGSDKPGGPLAEGVEAGGSAAQAPQQQQQQQHGVRAVQPSGVQGSTTVTQDWDLEQGGGSARDHETLNATAAAAADAAAATDVPVGNNCSDAAAAAGTAASMCDGRALPSKGNVWLLQGLADTLGIGKEAALADAAVDEAGRQPVHRRSSRLWSAAGGLWPDSGLCGCVCGGTWGPSHVPKMAPLTASQKLTNEAILQTANIPAADLLYVNYNNLVEGLLPYSVALDAAKRCVVVAIRGSLSVEDCVTDILYDPAPLDEDWLMQPATAVHLQQPQADAAPCQPPWLSQGPALAAAQQVPAAAAVPQSPLELQLLQSQEAALHAASMPDVELLTPGMVPSARSMPGASSGGGSFRSVKASPFASAAAAASVAARNSSTGVAGEDTSSRVGVTHQQMSLARMPSVPAAQAAAAAAAAAGQPLSPGAGIGSSRQLRRQWSINAAGLQQQQQTGKLSEQPSLLRRISTARRRRRQQQSGDVAQQMSPKMSLLDTALSVLKGPWRRTTTSDTGDVQHQHRQQHAAAVAAEEGRQPGRHHGGSTAAAGVPGMAGSGAKSSRLASGTAPESGSASSTPRSLLKTFSLNLATALGGARAQQQLSRRRLASTASTRPPSPRRESSVLSSYASELPPNISRRNSMRRSSTDNWIQSQTRRTTAADRALGAARAGHRFAPMTSPATDVSAAAAAANQRSFMQQQQQQQLVSMRSTAPASTESSVSAATGGNGGVVSEPGWTSRADSLQRISPTGLAAAAVAAAVNLGEPAVDSGSARSRRTTFSQLPRINSGAGAVDELLQQPEQQQAHQQPQQWPPRQQQQQQLLSMTASVPAPLMSELQAQQQQQQTSRARPVSDDGSSMGGSGAGRPPLRAAVSDVGRWARGLRLPLRGGHLPHQQQQQQLLDGGPTDWSLLSGAATMMASRTAGVPVAAAAASDVSSSCSTQAPGTPSSLLGQAVSHGVQPPGGFHPVGAMSGAGRGALMPAGGAAAADTGLPAAHIAGSSGYDQGPDVSPFMLQQQGQPAHAAEGHSAGDAAAAASQQQQQQPPPWMVQPLLDMTAAARPESAATVAAAAAAAAAAEEAALAEEVGAAAAAEADAAAAAVQAAAAEETPDTGAAGAQWFAHEGILSCARAIRDDLERLGLLDQLLLGPQLTALQALSHQQSQPGTTGRDRCSACTDSDNLAAVCASPLEQAPGRADEAGSKQAQVGAASGAPAAGKVGAEQGRWLRTSELPDCRGWTLVLTGHSLGAGVAALLGLHYRAKYESVRCWCFAPPGGLMSPAAAASLKYICYSLVSAKDMIPRMSLWTIERLRDEMMICALRCKMPKYKLLLCAALGKKFEEAEVMRPLEELTNAEVAAFQDYRRAVVEERSLDPLRVRIAREFVPPGEVLWLERCKELQPRLRGAAQVLSTKSTAPAAPWEQPDNTSNEPTPCERQHAGGSTQVAASSASLAAAAAAAPQAGLKTSASSAMLRSGTAVLGAAALAVAGKRVVSRLHPQMTDGLGLIVGGMVVSRNMFSDHVPDKQLGQLRRLVRALRRQQAAGQPLPAGIIPMVVAQPPQPQGMPARRL